MSVIKNFSKDLYPSIQDAILEILDEYIVSGFNGTGFNRTDSYVPIYSYKALNDILDFLAFNNIQHQYMKLPAPAGADCDELISLVWSEPGAVGHETWYSQGHGQKVYRVCLTMHAEDETEIEAWISNVDEMKILDWSVEEV